MKKHIHKVHKLENLQDTSNIRSNIVHKGLKEFTDYKCECCGKSFSKKEDLKGHIDKSLMIILQNLNTNWNSYYVGN